MSKLEDLARAEADRRYRINYAIPMPNELAASNGFMVGAAWAVSRVSVDDIETVIREASVEHYHSEYGYGLFTTDLDQIVEKVAALYRGEES